MTSRRFAPSGFAAVRTPLLAFDDLMSLAGPDGAGGGGHAGLRALVTRPDVREALFLASPDVATATDDWAHGGGSDRHLERALIRYVTRMAGRPTPFGLFAGTSVGTVGDRTRLVLAARDRYQRRSTAAVECLDAVVRALVASPEVAGAIPCRLNPTLYRVAGTYRYVEARDGAEGRSAHLVALHGGPALEVAVHFATGGDITPAELAEAIDPAGSLSTGRFVRRLIAEQVLLPNLGVTLTGSDPLADLVEQLRARCATRKAGDLLHEAVVALEALDAAGLGAPEHLYRALAARLAPFAPASHPARVARVDLLKPAADATLGTAVLDAVAGGIEVLHRLARRPPPDDLDRFRTAFTGRFGSREVPLLLALDPEAGVGFGSASPFHPLLNGLGRLRGAAPTEPPPWGDREDVLLDRLEGCGRELVLDEAVIETLAAGADPAPLPDAFSALLAVGARSDLALDQGDFSVHLRSVGGPSGAWLLGRAARLDSVIGQRVRQHLEAEEAHDGDAVFAEVVHQPEAPYGNVVLRPVLREYEIPVLGRSGARRDRQLDLDDLWVSVRDDEVALRSHRLERRVVPRLTSAHSYAVRGIPAYRFLCSLQAQGVAAGLAWRWGPLTGRPFLPRVRWGRIVFSAAQWRLDAADVTALRDPPACRGWRRANDVPRFVQLLDGGRPLVVDLENPVAVDSFIHLVRRRPSVIVEELLPGPDELCARGPEGRYVHELIVPFVAATTTPKPPPARVTTPSGTQPPRPAPIQRADWLYAKLFVAGTLADAALRDVLRPLVARLVGKGLIDQFHFVRYRDPDWHLRLRFHGAPDALEADVEPRLRVAVAPVLAGGASSRLEWDTYQPEVERYGGPDAVGFSEAIFSADSRTVLDVLHALGPGDASAALRWRIGLVGAHAFFTDFGIDADQRGELLGRLRRSFAADVGADRPVEDGLSARFRAEREGLELLFARGAVPPGPLASAMVVLDQRSARIAAPIRELRRLEAGGHLRVGLGHIAAAQAHLHLNRLFSSAHSAHELVIYDFLARLERSRAARHPQQEATDL